VAEHPRIEEQFVTLNGRKLHYAVAGQQDLPAVLLVHGAHPSLNWKVWDQNISTLAEKLQVFALDMPGYGQSAQHEGITLEPYPVEHFAMTLADFVAELRIGPATLIGFSAGGGASLLAAANNPSLVQRLVLVSSASARNEFLRKHANEVRLPTLLIWQEGDEVHPVEDGHALAALIPGSRMEILSGVDRPAPEKQNYQYHWPHRLNPERFNQLVLDFLNTP
jgi:pimeloyl-ACP methyl ester carboxylesterase